MTEEQNTEFTKSLILIGVIITIILVGGISYFYSSQSTNVTTNSTIATSAPTNMTLTTPENMTRSNSTEMHTATNATSMASVVEQNVTTQNYVVALQLGPPTLILTANQTMNATVGEVLVAGEPSSHMGTNMTNAHYLQVHIYNITSDAAVTIQNVTIQVVDNSTNQTLTVPVMKMYDLKIGISDTHFGNNVLLQPGSYTFIVTVDNETAKFNIIVASH